jgi:hypothetical protein
MDQVGEVPELGALIEALAGARIARVVARPGQVTLDRPSGLTPVALSWSSEQHRAATTRVGGGLVTSAGVRAVIAGDALVLTRPPTVVPRLDELVREGMLSSLAAQTLNAALALGRNLVVAGPWAASAELLAALVVEARRPAFVATRADAPPTAWIRVEAVAEATALGADRIGAWGVAPALVAELCLRGHGVAAWLDARRLDRALMRFELAVVPPEDRASAALAMLSSLDLVVIVSDAGAPRVLEISELVMVEDGYRPRSLFATGNAPVPTALVPVSAPGFSAELAPAGFAVLADELRHATGAPRRVAPGPEPRREPPRAPIIETPGTGTGALVAPPPHTTPGWELDQLSTEDLGDGSGELGEQDATMAATYGLAPPPRPPSLRDVKTFDEAMRRAKERDDEASGDE